jgi:hypothetical protein
MEAAMTQTFLRATKWSMLPIAAMLALATPASAQLADMNGLPDMNGLADMNGLPAQWKGPATQKPAGRPKGLVTKKTQSKSFGTPTDPPFLNLAQ